MELAAIVRGTCEGVMRKSRPLLLFERTMYRDGRAPFTTVFTVQVAGELHDRRLRQALDRIQGKHPLLRCVIEEAAGIPRFVLLDRAASIPLRIVTRNGEDDWQREVRREWVTPFDASRDPLVRFVWLRGGQLNELMLVAHHCICDGFSGMNLVRECLLACDEPEADLSPYETLGGMEDIAPAALLADRRFLRRARWKARLFRLMLLLRSHRKGERIAPGEMYFHRWNTGDASAFIGRCRSENVTVLTAVSVAFLQAFREVRGAMGKISAMVNARRFLPRMREDAMFGLVPSLALRTKNLPPEFWSQARAMRADLARRIDRLGSGLYETFAAFESLHDKYSSLVGYFESAPAVHGVTMSNLGKLELPQEYRTFRLTRVYSPLVMVSPTPANTVVLSSFAGEMEFAIISDERSLPRTDAIAISRRAAEILETSVVGSP
jgi:hypothetical protein